MQPQLLRKKFTENKIKITEQRKMVFDILVNNHVPITVEEIYMKLKNKKNNISLSTVYRILDVFVSKGLVVKSRLPEENKSQYELNRREHRHHLICISCKKILSFEDCPLAGYEKFLEKTTDFNITRHKLELFGFCPECKLAKNANSNLND